MPPSHHSSSSHRSHSSHSHHSSSHSHSSSRSYHSSSSHSSSYRSSGSSRNSHIVTPVYRSRQNQPTGYSGKSPRIYRCKNHDYVHYDHPWTDENGIEYKAGFYDENGVFYEDIVFSKQGEILGATTAVCRCDFCRMEDSRRWADREKPCTHCGGTMSLVSQVDDLVDDTGDLDDLAKASYEAEYRQSNMQIWLVAILLIFLSPCVMSIIGLVYEVVELFTGNSTNTYEPSSGYEYNTPSSSYEYNIPSLGQSVYLREEIDGSYVLIDEEEYIATHNTDNCKYLVQDSDGNYYDKESDMYVYLNEDLDPPQFQYWLEGLSSQYGDYGWMEYDAVEQCWYIEVSDEDWQPLSDDKYAEFSDRLWHIDYEFELK